MEIIKLIMASIALLGCIFYKESYRLKTMAILGWIIVLLQILTELL